MTPWNDLLFSSRVAFSCQPFTVKVVRVNGPSRDSVVPRLVGRKGEPAWPPKTPRMTHGDSPNRKGSMTPDDPRLGMGSMGDRSCIEWTNSTWNPVTGCSKVSLGCLNCYAERFARRLQAAGSSRYVNGFRPTIHPDLVDLPLRWARPRFVFVNSMSDLFHPAVPLDFIQQVFQTMERASWHVFQVLTKRPDRAAEIAGDLPWPENVWMGASVESEEFLHRIESLRKIPARVRFLSLEPLLGPMPGLSLEGIQWVIVGGESGPRARPMEPEWVFQIRDRCIAEGVSFFFKQWGGSRRRSAGRLLDGRTWDDLPITEGVSVSLSLVGD